MSLIFLDKSITTPSSSLRPSSAACYVILLNMFDEQKRERNKGNFSSKQKQKMELSY
jgi:hypothetical protein